MTKTEELVGELVEDCLWEAQHTKIDDIEQAYFSQEDLRGFLLESLRDVRHLDETPLFLDDVDAKERVKVVSGAAGKAIRRMSADASAAENGDRAAAFFGDDAVCRAKTAANLDSIAKDYEQAVR